MGKIDKDGREILDTTPVAIPLRLRRIDTIVDTVRNVIASERYKAYANEMGVETPEEADDFDVGDDYDPRSPYELTYDQELEGLYADGKGPDYTPRDPREHGGTKKTAGADEEPRSGGAKRVRGGRESPEQDEEGAPRAKRQAPRKPRNLVTEDEE